MNCRDALTELVALEDLNATVELAKIPSWTGGRVHSAESRAVFDDYQRRKPIAWANARAALAEEEPKPLPDLKKAFDRAFDLGQRYWQQADSESYVQNRKSFETRSAYDKLRDETVAAVAARNP